MSDVPKPAPRRVLLVVFVTLFLDLLGFGILIPIQPFYAEAFGASPRLITWLGGTYSLMQLIFAPMWGRLSDRFGRRPIVLTSIALGGVGYLAFGMAGSLPALFAARALSGFGNANIGTVQAIVADVTGPEDRAKGMGIMGAAFGLGFILGPAVGGGLGQLGLEVPAFAAAGLAAVNWTLALVILPETAGAGRSPKGSGRGIGAILRGDVLRAAVGRPGAARVLLLFLVVTSGFALMEQTLGLFIEHSFVPGDAAERGKRAAALTSYALLAVGVMATVVQGGLVGPLSRRFGERRLVQVGTGLQALTLALFPVIGEAGVFAWMVVGSAGLALGSGLSNPSMASLLSRTAGAEDQGSTLGLGQSLSALGRVLGPLAAGPLYEAHVAAPFWVGGGLLGLACLVALGVGVPTREPVASGA